MKSIFLFAEIDWIVFPDAMVWNIIVPIVARYAAVATLPVAIFLGGLGYYIERRYRGVPYTPVARERSIQDDRIYRQQEQEPTATPYSMDAVVPKTIFGRNNPDELRKRV